MNSVRIAPISQVNVKAAELSVARDFVYQNSWSVAVQNRVTAISTRAQFVYLGFENGDLQIIDVTTKAEEKHQKFHTSVKS